MRQFPLLFHAASRVIDVRNSCGLSVCACRELGELASMPWRGQAGRAGPRNVSLLCNSRLLVGACLWRVWGACVGVLQGSGLVVWFAPCIIALVTVTSVHPASFGV